MTTPAKAKAAPKAKADIREAYDPLHNVIGYDLHDADGRLVQRYNSADEAKAGAAVHASN